MKPVRASRHATRWDARVVGDGPKGTWATSCVLEGCDWKHFGFYDPSDPEAEADAIGDAMELGSAHERKHNH